MKVPNGLSVARGIEATDGDACGKTVMSRVAACCEQECGIVGVRVPQPPAITRESAISPGHFVRWLTASTGQFDETESSSGAERDIAGAPILIHRGH